MAWRPDSGIAAVQARMQHLQAAADEVPRQRQEIEALKPALMNTNGVLAAVIRRLEVLESLRRAEESWGSVQNPEPLPPTLDHLRLCAAAPPDFRNIADLCVTHDIWTWGDDGRYRLIRHSGKWGFELTDTRARGKVNFAKALKAHPNFTPDV